MATRNTTEAAKADGANDLPRDKTPEYWREVLAALDRGAEVEWVDEDDKENWAVDKA